MNCLRTNLAWLAFAGATAIGISSERTLTPGETFHLAFPELGETWQRKPARAGVYLPSNYSSARKWPLFVWFGGGAGNDDPSKAAEITAGRDFVCVALPYQPESSTGDQGGWKTSWTRYRTMLDRLEAVVPNLDPQRRVAGGFSSGGAAVLYQIGNSGGEFQLYFHAFLPGGAGWPMGGLESLKGRPMLAFMGEKDKRLPNYRVLEKEAIAAGVDFRFLLLTGVGHVALPAEFIPEVRAWLKASVIDRPLPSPQPATP